MDQVGASDQIPLLVASSNGDVDLVKLLKENGADVNLQVCSQCGLKREF